eukprot:6460326-Amphidinium_carterae.1
MPAKACELRTGVQVSCVNSSINTVQSLKLTYFWTHGYSNSSLLQYRWPSKHIIVSNALV